MALVFPKAFPEIAFRQTARFHATIVWIESTFASPRLVPLRSVGHSMDGDRIEQVLAKHPEAGSVGFAAHSDHWLKRFQRLYPSLEAAGSWLNAVSGRRLGREWANEIVCQDMYSALLLDQLRALPRKTSFCSVVSATSNRAQRANARKQPRAPSGLPRWIAFRG
jgi:hypothetical protein